MDWIQHEIRLHPRPRGIHLITHEIERSLPELSRFRVGMVHVFILHTSASLSLNENADPDVRIDLEEYFDRIAPENEDWYRHTMEGPDDMPAHIKSSLFGSSLTVPVTDGRLRLGMWQGIYLCEHRNRGGTRRLVVTVHGDAGPKAE